MYTNCQFTYDPQGRCVKIAETVNGSLTDTKQLVWCGSEVCETRDSGGNTVTAKFFPWGEISNGTTYFYELNHRNDIVGVTDNAGTELTAITYDPYGVPTMTFLSGSVLPNFGFAGMYFHQPSQLSLTRFRPYSSTLGRWLTRDPIAEAGGSNLYAYCANDPISIIDSLGLQGYSAPQEGIYDKSLTLKGGVQKSDSGSNSSSGPSCSGLNSNMSMAIARAGILGGRTGVPSFAPGMPAVAAASIYTNASTIQLLNSSPKRVSRNSLAYKGLTFVYEIDDIVTPDWRYGIYKFGISSTDYLDADRPEYQIGKLGPGYVWYEESWWWDRLSARLRENWLIINYKLKGYQLIGNRKL